MKNSDYTIKMVRFTDQHIIEKDGVYLIQTLTNHKKNIRTLSAICKIKKNVQNESIGTIISVSNQKVTHISIKPLYKN